HRYDDLIQFVHTSQATSRPVNIGKARVWGVEVTAQKTIWKQFGLSGNYTYQRALDQSDVPHLRGNTLPNRPAHTLFARLTGVVNRVTAFYDYTFEDGNFLDQANRRPLASRHVHNVGMKIGIVKGVQAGLEAKNLRNAQIADTWGYPLPGRAFFVNVQEHF
ncbi:MAG: TonB-dependent receptor, partial [Candidatus Latescibacterota bacterium]